MAKSIWVQQTCPLTLSALRDHQVTWSPTKKPLMFMLVVYLLIYCNSGTLSLWDVVPTPSDPVPKRENLFLLMLFRLNFFLIYFCIFIICNYFISIYIICLTAIIFKMCTKCICNLALSNSIVVGLYGLVVDEPNQNKSTEWPNVI